MTDSTKIEVEGLGDPYVFETLDDIYSLYPAIDHEPLADIQEEVGDAYSGKVRSFFEIADQIICLYKYVLLSYRSYLSYPPRGARRKHRHAVDLLRCAAIPGNASGRR